jgi:serine palmitoyltransferase
LALKHKYKYRLIVEESMSIGVLGKSGKGVSEHFGVPAKEIDFITGSLSNAFASTGGFCAGSRVIVDHQRLSSQGYCFSASLPAVLTVVANEALNLLKMHPSLVSSLHQNAKIAHKYLRDIPTLETSGSQESPMIHLRIKQRQGLTYVEQKTRLQSIVTEALKRGVLLTMARYVEQQERHLPDPSIRFVVSACHNLSEIERATEVVTQLAMHLGNK